MSEPSRGPGDGSRRYPVGGRMADVVEGLARRFGMPALEARYDSNAVHGLFAFVNGFISIGLMSVAALVTGQPFVFPALGPSAFLFFYSPLAPHASPRNTILGHLIGILAGWASLAVFGLLDAGSALTSGFTLATVGAAALSLAVTNGAMAWLRVPHPPASATTLIVSLGLVTRPADLAVLILAVVLITLQAIVINRLAGLPYPLWGPRPSGQDSGGGRH